MASQPIVPSLQSASHRYSRRSALQIGFCTALGLSASDLLRADEKRAAQGNSANGAEGKSAPAKSVIHIQLPGGFAAQESWDPKPEASVEYRGAFGVVKTNTGDLFSDRFPRTAQIADKITVLRSCYTSIPDHAQAIYHLNTGYLPTTVIDYPQMGAVVSHRLGPRAGLPPYIAIPEVSPESGNTGYLSGKYGAFSLGGSPDRAGKFQVQDMVLPGTLTDANFRRRQSMRSIVEKQLRAYEGDLVTLDAMDDFYKQAYTLVSSPEARAAFTLDTESAETKKLYGVGEFVGPFASLVGGKLLLARRLVEAGVRFLSVNNGANWDDHIGIQKSFVDKAPELDQAIAGLITDLDQRGLLKTTLVMITTEFGRTPKINKDGGRDHWARSYSMILAGAGITRGQVYGASDATASEPAQNPLPLEDFLYTVYNQIGIDADDELLAFGTRPIEIIKGGKLAKGLLR
jgi:hypothetical protein